MVKNILKKINIKIFIAKLFFLRVFSYSSIRKKIEVTKNNKPIAYI